MDTFIEETIWYGIQLLKYILRSFNKIKKAPDRMWLLVKTFVTYFFGLNYGENGQVGST